MRQKKELSYPRKICSNFTVKSVKSGIYTVKSCKSTLPINSLKKRDLKFDIQHFFAPAVDKWLEATDANSISWVERAVKNDTLQPENDEMKQSSSAMDLFQFIGQAVDFLKKLE